MRAVLRHSLTQQLWKFALVGGIGFVVDTVSFTLLRLTPMFAGSPIKAGFISTVLAIAVNWIGNRYWTFGALRRTHGLTEAAEFVAVSLLGMAVALACLWFTHYVLGFTSVLADNISKNVIGLILGSALRFVLYRAWVYHPRRRHRVAVRTPREPREVEPTAADTL
jgi:putative flippase GtrA